MDKRAPEKKSVNLLIDAGLLRRARAEKINLSATLHKAIQQEMLAKWREDSKGIFEEHRKRVEAQGLWSDGLRTF